MEVRTRTNGGYDGSPDILTSTESQEIIPQPITTIVNGIEITKSPYNRSIYDAITLMEEFHFYNTEAVHIKINGENIIYLEAGDNLLIDKNSPAIFSFIIIDAGIHFSWIGNYV